MVPIGFEALSLRDHVVLLRLNLGCIAASLPVVLLFTLSWRWQTGALVIAVGGGLCILGFYAEPILRRLDATIGGDPCGTATLWGSREVERHDRAPQSRTRGRRH